MAKSTLEKRFFTGEFRAVDKPDAATDGDTLPCIFKGEAAVYDVPSLDFGEWYEIIKPGTFTESLESSDLRCLVGHNWEKLLGRRSAKTLRFLDSAKSLLIENDPPNTSYARDLWVVMKRLEVTGMSFLFDVTQDSWTTDKDGRACRTVFKAKIHEVSFVADPAYDKTTASVCEATERSLDAFRRSRPPQSLPDDFYRDRQRLWEAIHRN